jgi:hypothetical protein
MIMKKRRQEGAGDALLDALIISLYKPNETFNLFSR